MQKFTGHQDKIWDVIGIDDDRKLISCSGGTECSLKIWDI